MFTVCGAAYALLGVALKSLAAWLDSSIALNWLRDGEWSGHTPQILLVVTVWAAIPLVAGLIWTARREIN